MSQGARARENHTDLCKRFLQVASIALVCRLPEAYLYYFVLNYILCIYIYLMKATYRMTVACHLRMSDARVSSGGHLEVRNRSSLGRIELRVVRNGGLGGQVDPLLVKLLLRSHSLPFSTFLFPHVHVCVCVDRNHVEKMGASAPRGPVL